MKTLLKSFMVAALLAGASQAALAAPAKTVAAAPAGGVGVNGIAIANLEAILYNSAAFKKAQVDREITYKPQIDAAKAREVALNGQIKPMYDKFQKDRATAGANPADLQKQVAAIQALQEQGKAEVEKLIEPVRLSDAYVVEQISEKRAGAVVAAMNKTGVSLLLNPEAVLHVTSNAYNLSQAILDELNATTPSVQVVPPAGWLPREVREQQAQQAGAQQAPAQSR